MTYRRRTLRAIALIAAMLLIGNERLDRSPGKRLYPAVAHLMSREAFNRLDPLHQQMIARVASEPGPGIPVCCCLEAGEQPDWDLLQAFEAVLGVGLESQILNRWTNTATNGPTGAAGDPITLTYSFIPDGTAMYSGFGEPAAPSDLIATFNQLFGSSAAWQAHFDSVFARWAQLSGVSFVFEPNDDGVATVQLLPGVIGVRGDIRIGGHYIDGPGGSNILAYSSYPSFGDIVIDTSNTGFFSSQFNDAVNLRNLCAHEAGHAIGLKHVCPSNGMKLMEPFISTGFDGPQSDDIQGAQRNYGDRFEKNDTESAATDLGVRASGTLSLTDLSCDSNTDADWFRFTINDLKTVTLTVTPVGSTYLEGPEISGSCSGATPYDSLSANDLGVEIHDQAGTMLAGANTHPAGVPESIAGFDLPASHASYTVRVYAGSTNAVQMYRLDLALTDTGAASSVGSGCGAGTVHPALSSTSPILGAVVTIMVKNAKPNTAGALVASLGTSMPVAVGGGCVVYVDLANLVVVASFVTSPAGSWSLTGSLPFSPSLSGVDVVLQAAIFPTGGPIGVDITNGVTAQIGY